MVSDSEPSGAAVRHSPALSSMALRHAPAPCGIEARLLLTSNHVVHNGASSTEQRQSSNCHPTQHSQTSGATSGCRSTCDRLTNTVTSSDETTTTSQGLGSATPRCKPTSRSRDNRSYSSSGYHRKRATLFTSGFMLLALLVTVSVLAAATEAARDNRKSGSGRERGGGKGRRNKCPNCVRPEDEAQRQAVDRARVEAVKHQILSKLGMKQKPNITQTIPRDVLMDTLWRADETMDLLNPRVQGNRPQSDADDYYARTSEIITFAEPGGQMHDQTLLQFSNRHDNPHSLRVKSATLWVQLKFRAPLTSRHFRHVFGHDQMITLYVFRIKNLAKSTLTSGGLNDTSSANSSTGKPPDGGMEMITSVKMPMRHMGWRKFDVQLAVQKWFAGPLGQKMTLLIDCVGCQQYVRPVIFTEPEGRNGRRHSEAQAAAARGSRPFLAVVTEPVPLHRVRRRALDCDARTTQCCKKSLYISFKMLQWDDWIIAPQGYYANYCMGDCSRRGRTPDTFARFHTHVIEEYRNRNPYAVIPQCCAPSKLASMSLIYFDQDLNIIKTDLPNMIVDECGCA